MGLITLQTPGTDDAKVSNTLLNRVVAEVLGWKPGQICNGPYVDYVTRFQCIRCNAQLKEKDKHEYHIPNYTENLVFAMAITHKCTFYSIEGYFAFQEREIDMYQVTLESGERKVKVTASSLPRALCLAYYYLIQTYIPTMPREWPTGEGILPIGEQEQKEVPV